MSRASSAIEWLTHRRLIRRSVGTSNGQARRARIDGVALIASRARVRRRARGTASQAGVVRLIAWLVAHGDRDVVLPQQLDDVERDRPWPLSRVVAAVEDRASVRGQTLDGPIEL